MIELTTGSITVDDLDISTMPRDEVRSRIIGVSQDTYLLRGNVRLNADPTGSTSDETIIEVLKKVQLWEVLHEKGGLELELDEKVLSHGQRQLFCLARAMLRQSRILILDEATSRYVSLFFLLLSSETYRKLTTLLPTTAWTAEQKKSSNKSSPRNSKTTPSSPSCTSSRRPSATTTRLPCIE